MNDLGLPPADLLVPAAVPLSVRDFGRHPQSGSGDGWGGDVVLLPSARGTAASWDVVGTLLRGLGYRPVAIEPRGHGRSGDGDWTWDAVLGDVAAVVDALGLDRPAVIGHGLGGTTAAGWAARHPECPLAVTIDGYGNPTRPEQLAALSPDANRDAVIVAFSDHLARSVPATLGQALRAVESLDLLHLYRAVRCPTVAVLSRESDLADLLPTELGLAWLAYLEWVTSALTGLAAEVPALSVLRVDGPNDAYLTQPEQLTDLLADLLPAPAALLA
ncbi:alpha/beta fold hydrolase [Cryptosporangium phraense]|uniref:Alpha/beta hydrolase n=1 Tax=Cryptosporangium phraense TaxID=2593070 RepID=A0A545ATS2_9ACTN|nr:alpha/beta hydrolase [Cryptosporangium phraense]TQS44671.1 alpha/beta hydrolase [Cryptosporangium phraense]